jgi:hypothetical protein
MHCDPLNSSPVEGLSHSNSPYTAKILLKTFIVRENNEPRQPFVFGPSLRIRRRG